MNSTPELQADSSGGRALAIVRAQPYLLALGIVLVFAGQILLLGTTLDKPDAGMRQLAAGILLILGAVLFGLAALCIPYADPLLEFRDQPQNQSAAPWNQPKAGITLSMILSLAAIVLFAQTGETPVIVALWPASILVLLLTQFWRAKFVWPAGLSREWPYLTALAVVLAIAVVTRVYHLATLPDNFDGDYASFGLQARALLSGMQSRIFTFGWAAIPMPGYFPAASTMKLFGNNLVGLKVSGVIEGLLSILGVYLLGRDLFHPRVGLIAAALLTVSYTHIAASRQAQYIDPVPFVVFSIYFLLIGLREQRGWAIVASGIAAASCFELYYSGRIVIPIVLYLFLFLFIFHRHVLFRRSGWLLLWLLALLITLGPMLLVFGQDLNSVLGRSREVFILNPTVVMHTMGGYRVSTISAMLLEQARRSVLMFHYYPDTDTQFGFKYPFLDAITAPLFTLGLGLAAFQLRRLGTSLLAAWTILGVIIGCFLTVNPPFWTRLMILLPPAALLAALALNALYEFVQPRLDQRPRIVGLVAPVALSLLLAWIGIRNWNTYVQQGAYANALTRIARYMADQPPATRAYLVSTSGWTIHIREFEFLIPGRFVADLPPDQVKPGIARVGSPTLLILTSEQTALANELPQLYPGGTLTIGPDNAPNGVAFYAFRLP
jgi:Dolichyl-phosphate-mannose-protein mannosyltransferase